MALMTRGCRRFGQVGFSVFVDFFVMGFGLSTVL